MRTVNKKSTNFCSIFRQVSVFQAMTLILLFMMAPMSMAQDKDLTLNSLDPFSKVQTRRPSNFIPSDDVQPAPFIETRLWVNRAFIADNEGVLDGIRNSFRSWKDTEEYAKVWNLESTGLYSTPSHDSRVKMLKSHSLKYADKRLNGEMRNAEEGTVMASANKAQKALRPQAEVGVSQNVKFKFRARALQGETQLLVINPWFDYQTQYRVFQGQLTTTASKDFKAVGVKTGADYDIKAKRWTASVDKKITEEVSARLTSAQAQSNMAFGPESDRIIQLMYSKGW